MSATRLMTLAALAVAALAALPGSAGSVSGACGLAFTSDPAYLRFDRTQSVSAAKICAVYLNREGTVVH